MDAGEQADAHLKDIWLSLIFCNTNEPVLDLQRQLIAERAARTQATMLAFWGAIPLLLVAAQPRQRGFQAPRCRRLRYVSAGSLLEHSAAWLREILAVLALAGIID